MTRWHDFAAAEPELARTVGDLLGSQKHMTVATLRQDGSPRISGTEARIEDGELRLGMMAGSVKALDLLRDPRLALHSPAVDPPEGDPAGWVGDAKVAGRAVADTGPGDGSHEFRVDVTEVVVTKVGIPADHLVITSWHPGRGVEVRRRY